MKNCARILHCVKSLPNTKTVGKFLDTACDIGNDCIRTLKTDSVEPVYKCIKSQVWAIYNGTEVIPYNEMLCIEKAADCGAGQVGSIAVAKLQISYLRRLFG
ncbi:uncharacterized protein [Dermacentor andersoni]|uniref:uncharacterized protein n=1 Tax=Dermacentor andersoni TaxID=34620 RepID=UPI002416F88C|nr:uncharacterized protein LOC129382765 [Dermacentor andersoni]